MPTPGGRNNVEHALSQMYSDSVSPLPAPFGMDLCSRLMWIFAGAGGIAIAAIAIYALASHKYDSGSSSSESRLRFEIQDVSHTPLDLSNDTRHKEPGL